MTRIVLCGCCGKMGKFISSVVDSKDDMEIVAGVDLFGEQYSYFPVFKSFGDVKCECDVIIDFSNPDNLDSLLKFALDNNTPSVICTTGFSDDDVTKINNSSKKVPIFFSFNMSLGVNLLTGLCQKAAKVLGDDFDIEIIEKHHNMKKDAPSGTAIMLADAINGVFDGNKVYEYDRHSKRAARNNKEIGIHSIRGGTIVGEHEVMFCGRDEIISLKHSAASREVFAVGAVNAAKYLINQKPGLYNMNDIISD